MPRDLVAQAKQEIQEIDVQTLEERLQQNASLFLLDVREAEELEAGKIEGAAHIPRGLVELRVASHVHQIDREIVIYCAAGSRSALTAKTLQDMGFSRVSSLAGGFAAWKSANKKIAQSSTLTASQRARYGRHILLPQVGEEGQAKLLASKVLLLGAGGLGSPAALYLAAAGVGTLGIVDDDLVELSNLQRQILHTTTRVGVSKVESAREALRGINPEVRVIAMQERVSAQNIERLIEGFDVVLDGTDNFPTRYLVNDACVAARKPNIHGAIYRFDGQLTVFDPSRGGPCYRCLYPEAPPAELVPSCQMGGVLGVLPGVIGVLQATEALKLLLGIGEPLLGRLLLYDALEQSLREIKTTRDEGCKICSSTRESRGFADEGLRRK